MKNPKRFPVLWPPGRKVEAALREAGCPHYVPWNLVAAHEDQAITNHGQTVQRLAERGGMSPLELVAVLTDRCWSKLLKTTSGTEAVEQLLVLLKAEGTPP